MYSLSFTGIAHRRDLTLGLYIQPISLWLCKYTIDNSESLSENSCSLVNKGVPAVLSGE